MKKNEANVIAVVVLYNPDFKTIKDQYSSFVHQVESIIYIDNGSKNINEIVDYITQKNKQNITRKNKQEILTIKNGENKGLGFAQNQGIRIAIENNATHVLILDHDSILQPNFVDNLLNAESKLISENIKVGAVGPIYINEKTNEIYPITKYYGPFIKRVIPNQDYVKASFLISSGCLIKVEAINEIGLMNEDLFVDYIDVEWSYRATSMGFSLYAVPKSKMSHTVGDKRMSVFGRTISVHTPIRRYFLTRNSIHMLKMPYVSLGYKVREVVFNVLRIIVFTIVSNERSKFLRFSFRGFYHGLIGVKGEYK